MSHCGSTLQSGMAVCGECGSEIKEISEKETGSPQEEQRGRKNVYAILVIFLVVVGGVALLMITGLLPNPIKEWFYCGHRQRGTDIHGGSGPEI